MEGSGRLSARSIVRSGKDIIERPDRTLAIPDTFLALLPAFDAPVLDVLEFTFPPLNIGSSQLITPSVTMMIICPRQLADWQNVRQQDGINSILHVTNDGNVRYYPSITVIAIYVKEGGYNGMNLWVPQTSHLGHISYVAVQTYQKVASRARYHATHLGRPMEIRYYRHVPTNELLMRVGFLNTPRADAEEVELKDRQVIEERDELVRILPELEKAGIPRVGSKTGGG